MPGNIETPTLDENDPLIPKEAVDLRNLIDAMANAKTVVQRTDQVGDIGSFAFRYQGGFMILVLPVKSPTVMPAISAVQMATAINAEADLPVSSPPTQAEVTAIRDAYRSLARYVAQLTDVLRANTFPS